MDKVNITVMSLDAHLKLSIPDPETTVETLDIYPTVSTSDPEMIQLNGIMAVVMTKAFMINTLPASIGPNNHSDMNGSEGRLYQMAYKGCSHITTNLGPHRAQTK